MESEMKANKSLFDDLVGKVQSSFVKQKPKKTPSVENEGEGEVDHLWMTEDHSQIRENPVVERDPRIDTGILKYRIKEKHAKLNANPS